MAIGKRTIRVDAYDKVTGRAKYTDDLCDKNALVARIVHSTIAHGYVKTVDTSEAERMPGVVKVLTCFDVPNRPIGTAGHPWHLEAAHRDVEDRLLLNRHVRFYGDDVAVVIAEDDVTADRAARAVKVEYEELPFVLDVREAMEDGAPQLHEEFKNNILGHTSIYKGNFAEAIKEEGLIKVEGWYDTPLVQHCHIENPVSYAYMEAGKVVVVASTQIPHIVRRVTAQALSLPWGSVRIVKPYIGGGFGNKQDALYEPLNAWLTTQVGGRLVKLEISREETFYATRTRHAIRFHLTSYVRPDGTFVARKFAAYSDQGAYASHGHGIAAKGMGAFPQLYPCDNLECDAYTVFTNKPVAGAMRGYGIPQAMFAGEAHIDDIAKALDVDPLEYRMRFVMPKGYAENFSMNVNYADSFRECLEKGMEEFDFKRKQKAYANQTGDIRRGVGVAVFWYNTGVWPISLESSACRMVLNQDGTIQLQMGETEIGQGADTTFAQMAADTLGIPFKHVHVISTQDTDITPFGTGAYASRQTYMGGFAIHQTALQLRDKILKHAQTLTRMPSYNLDLVDGYIVRTTDGERLMSLGKLATDVLYSMEYSEHITAESTYQCNSNAYSFGCSFAEVEVDIPMCKATLIKLTNVHDCGTLINPALAEAQVHGGMSMAIGYGLQEKMLFDEKTGRMLNDNLLDYKLCTTMDHPDLTALFVENAEPTSAYGTKSLGEPPTCSGAPAIRNAILHATGVAINETPITPHVLFERFNEENRFERLKEEQEEMQAQPVGAGAR
ncbi:MAG TPA: xanthine dehydrogenase molybdenum-binding subunit XdhA [Fastidiosipila sp.]|jgi:xanthine dehydrogenase molybdenum-binding subunit|nr:xanthine dehydrogenase molybdenum-binding subunit XdhA [Fastidiosipila sp.]